MKTLRLATVAAVVLMVAATPVLLSASDDALPSNDGKAVQQSTDKTSPAQFATLKGVKAVPMAVKELKAVKGMHVHFFNGSNNVLEGFEGLHLAGINNTDHWTDLYGQGPVANSYHGLCKATGNGSAIFIEPGGGCGF